MKSPTNVLYPNDEVAKNVVDYAGAHSAALPKHITDYHAWIVDNHPRSHYIISNNQAQFNIFIARTAGAKRILEIGTFIGYSSLAWAHAVGQDGHVTTLEFSEEYANAARELFKKNDIANVEVVQGDALETLGKLIPEQPYDMVFIDAQKSGYPSYLQTILEKSQPGSSSRLLREGGLIVADNVLRRALVADDSENNPYHTGGSKKKSKSEYETDDDLIKLREYNDMAANNARLEAYLLPLFDGVAKLKRDRKEQFKERALLKTRSPI